MDSEQETARSPAVDRSRIDVMGAADRRHTEVMGGPDRTQTDVMAEKKREFSTSER